MIAEEANSFQQRQIGAEHLLLGLLRQQDGLVPRILSFHGVSLAKARDIVAELTDSAFKPAAQRDATQRARIDHPGAAEFVSDANDDCLAKSELELLGHVPRIGEEVILTSGTSIGAYRVRDVTYVYLKATEEGQFVPRKLAKIVIRVDPAGAVRGAKWEAMT